MTHQNHQTNGASLEDCHTNFFALTELYGIKWRKLVWGESSGCGDEEGANAPLSDPVISSYARCLAGDILCVWRRVPASNPSADPYEIPAPAPPPPLSLKAAKELWIFWYGEEPDYTGLVAPELMASQGEQGSWESGLSYECRSLLFKALHNLIERCLLSRDFVRLGKWFVQPYDGDEEDVGKSPWHLSFSFAFFLHGESTVCASVDVRQHPPVRTLTAKRLAKLNAPEHRADNKVILAPFGLEGSVTGRQWGDSDAGTARLLDAWRQLYPLEQGCGAVEVVVEGVRMRYPAPYVLVTEMESAAPLPPPAPSAALARRTAAALTTPAPHQPTEVCYADPGFEKGDDFVDPTRKTLCTCAKGMVGACSPGSCGVASPAPAVSAPSSAGPPPPPSPHPPTNTNIQGGGIVPASLHTPAPTPDPLAPHTPAPPSANNAKFAQGDSPPSGMPTHQNSFPSDQPVDPLKRPLLRSPEPKVEPQDDDNPLNMLYNYDTVYAWLEHPVKRFKSDEPSFREELALGFKDGDLYAGHDHTKMATIDHTLLQIKQEKQEPDDTKEYKNLFTSDGLYATLKDLDQIFDNSDETSGDETLAVQTPPDSNKSVEDIRSGGGRCVRPEELSKMFPTPPSMEVHAQPSPGCPLPDDPTTALQRQSPPPDPIEDWSYVFKPPTVCKYVGSSKYAPLSTLPSQLLPPVTLPPHAVYRPRWQRDSSRSSTGATKRSATPPDGRTSTNTVAARLCGPGSVPSAAPSPAAPPSAPPRLHLSPPPSPRAQRNACPLLVNVLLADTVLNVFRDHNFDSCTLCVCNAGNKTVGNIRGADAAVYLPNAGRTADDEPSSCSCGFSAIVNRRLAHRAGLFYEDEMEITGVAEEPGRGARGPGLTGVAGAVVALCGPTPAPPAAALARAASDVASSPAQRTLNVLEYSDGGCAASIALRAAVGEKERERSERAGVSSAVHRWPFIGARAPRSSRDVVRLMRRLRPLLQDAIQKRCCGARMWDGVTGPLTWRQFHRLAGRGNEDLCEPQPVPKLLVGHDKDWLSISPYALSHWERLSLEPYSYSRDVAYVVLCPDGDVLTDPLRTFFREVSTAYESCRLGRHQPISRLAKDGLFRSAPSERDSNCEEWTGDLPPGRLGEYIKAYAEVLRNTIVPQLANLSVDKTLFESESKCSVVERAAPSPMRPPSTPDHPPTPSSQSDQEGDFSSHAANGATGGIGTPSIGNCNTSLSSWEEDETVAPSLVIYIVEPPATHAYRAHALHSLLRLSAAVSQRLQHHNPLVKLISLESVCEWWGEGCSQRGESRALAFSVFTSARRLLQHNANGKSLTGFGTAAHANLILQAKDEKNRAPYKLFSPLWVLAPGVGGGGSVGKDAGDTWGGGGGGAAEAVLYVSYCLSHDQRWLHATASDARGELLHANTINIHVPNRSRRRRDAGARRLGLTKLMDWTLGVMSQTAQPWRLVIGRVGRIGHGELKGWSWLLSKKNLVRASTVLREICASCSALHPMYPSAVPCILSACLVSTEPDSCLRLMADRFTPDERFSQASIQSHLHTPRDVTATHILVFPTSATATQSNQSNVGVEEGDGFFLNVDMGDDEDGVTEMLDDMFNIWPTSPRRADSPASRDGSPRPTMYQQYSNQDHNQEQVGTVLQQPLALGYMVSTAPLGSMPAWWWAGSTHLREACPAFLKNALHLHAGSVQSADDFTSLCARRDHNTHPLDSPITTDVLRYVLEGYNALSWLALDGNTHDRVSCLPLHVQVLMQLYHTAAALG